MQLAVNTENWRVAAGQVQVRRFLLEHQIEEGINLGHTKSLRLLSAESLGTKRRKINKAGCVLSQGCETRQNAPCHNPRLRYANHRLSAARADAR